VLLALVAGCSGTEARYEGGPVLGSPVTPSPSPPPPGPLADPTGLQPYGDARYPAYAASPLHSTLTVRSAPGGKTIRTMSNRLPLGAPLTLLVVNRKPGWLQVELPVRPNGSTGWVRESDVRLTGVKYGLAVERGRHRLLLYDGDRLMRTFSVGIGTNETPTPGGLYYLIELLRPPDPNGAYGPYAYGLSGFSNVLHHFNGGDGVIGLHGTNEPSKVGHDVSHGCIRMYNRDVSYLAHLLPLGTPIRILA
jgi:hypothetical protein